MSQVLGFALLAVVIAAVVWCFVDAWRIVQRDTAGDQQETKHNG